MLAALRALWILAVAGLVVALLMASRDAVDAEAQDLYGRELRRLQALDARLNAELMRARGGAAQSYDPIVRTLADLGRTRRALSAPPAFIGTAGRREVSDRLLAFDQAARVKEDLLDAFKTQHAVLRSSLRFFPVAAKDLAGQLGPEPESRELAARLHDLLRDVLMTEVVSDEDALPRARAAAAALEAAGAPSPRRGEVEILLRHARVIVAREPRVNALVEQILAVPSSAAAERLDAAYSRRYHAALVAAGRGRLLLGILAVTVIAAAAGEVILRLKRSTSALEEATVRLRAANVVLGREREREKELGDLRSRFVSMTSHEFRTPLSIIQSSGELLEAYAERWPAEKKRRHYLRVFGAVKTMTKMLDGILLIGRVEAGALALTPLPIDVPRFCAELVDAMQESAGGRHRVELHVEGGWDDALADERLLSQILTNLLSNAIKYSPEGGAVDLFVRREGADAVLEVHDHGIGIPEGEHAKVFEGFHRASNARRIHGTGLGLAIVKRAAELHEGHVSFESEPGRGTRFTARIRVRGHRMAGEGGHAA